MSFYKKLVYLCFAFCVFFLFNSCCLNNENIDYEEYEKNSLFSISIHDASEGYVFICTKDYEIITHDYLKNETVKSNCTDIQIVFIDMLLKNIVNENPENTEFSVDDYWATNLYIGENEYYFTYGISNNPYINMLVELVIGASDYEDAQETLVPYPSTFRDA